MHNIYIKEVTKDNKDTYINQIADLEIKVLKDLEEKGKIGQLFITGKEDVETYVDSKENTVIVAEDDKGIINSAAYITQGQLPFTYNDITKYFKFGDEYKQHIKSTYESEGKYILDMLNVYQLKILAFKQARNRILSENKEYRSITEFLEKELTEENNNFHEKSELRENINKYMAEFFTKIGEKDSYNKFYFISAKDIFETNGKDYVLDKEKNADILEYEQILENMKLTIYEKPEFETNKYFTANTDNSVEIDTYITDPENRKNGIARINVYEGIKKHINTHFQKDENKEIFLCSTLHAENFSSKYVSEFFGLKDSLAVNRRSGRDREVHICKITREQKDIYLENIEDKLNVFYGYNPNNKKLSNKKQKQILEEQLMYELRELDRLEKIRKDKTNSTKCTNYTGKIETQSKLEKIEKIKSRIISLNNVNEIGEER